MSGGGRSVASGWPRETRADGGARMLGGACGPATATLSAFEKVFCVFERSAAPPGSSQSQVSGVPAGSAGDELGAGA